MSFNVGPGSANKPAYVDITPVEKRDLEITSISSNNPEFSVTQDRYGGQWRVGIAVDPQALKTGKSSYSTVLSVQTNSERRPQFEIYATARPISMLKAIPSCLVLASSGLDASMIVDIATFNSRSFRVDRVILDSNAYGCEVDHDEFSTSHQIRFYAFDKHPHSGQSTAVVEAVELGSTDIQRVEIPIFVLLKEA